MPKVLSENTEELMPIVYTPTVGLACQKFGLVFRRPKGLFITIHDKGHVYDVLKNWPEQDVRLRLIFLLNVSFIFFGHCLLIASLKNTV